MSDMWICLILTVFAIIFNLAASCRAIKIAMHVEDCPWICKRGSRHCSMQILLGFAIICFILASLKLWSIQDVFLRTWDMMPDTYHVRSFAYLGENFGVAILCWRVATYIEFISGCNGKGGD